MQEDESVEYKEIVVDDIKKEIIAFANTKGGTLYVGIRDDGTVVGLLDADKAMQQATNMIRDAIKPDVTMFVRSSFETIDTKQVLAMQVSEGTNKPYYLTKHGLKPSGVFVRQGASSVPASDEQIRRMIRDTDGDTFEKMRSLEQNLTFTFVQSEFKKQSLAFGSTQLQTLGLCDSGGQFTNAALLLSDQNPFTVKCAVFTGNDQNAFQDRREFSGSLLQQLSDIYAYLEQHNQLGATFSGLYRTDTRDYPQTALREALLNCLVHRDYSYSASTLISLYADRIEFVSIGGLLPGVTLADVQMGLSVCRNKTLADIFYRLTLIEAYGTGLQKIQNAYKQAEQQPQILTAPHAFKIILPNMNHTQKIPQPAITPIPQNNETAVLAYAKTHAPFTRPEIDALLHTSQPTSSRLLKKLVAEGKLIQRGNGKAVEYHLGNI